MTGRADRLRYAGQLVAVAALYFGAALLGLLAAVAQKVVSSAWPPTGVALAALILGGVRLWPAVAGAAFLLNWTAGVPAAGAAGIAVGNTLEAVAGALLLVRVAGLRPSLERLRDVLALVGFGALASTVLSATGGLLSLRAVGAVPADGARALWPVWWLGDALGALLVAPLVLTWAVRGPVRWTRARLVEGAVLGTAVPLAAAALFRSPVGAEYAIFPLVIWAALRFGPRGAATASALVAVVTIWSTLEGIGPFAGASPTHSLFLLQLYLALIGATGLVLAAITAQLHQARRAARDSENRYRALVQSAPDPMVVVDPGGRIALVNSQTEQLFGYPHGELLGQPVELLVPERFRGRHPGHRATYFADPQPRPMGTGLDLWARRKDGTELPVEISLAPVETEAGTLVMAAVRDLTERRAVEDALRQRQELVRAVFDRTAVGIGITDLGGRFIQTNTAYQTMVGYSDQELCARTFLDLTHPDDAPWNRRLLERLLAGGADSCILEKRLRHKGGGIIWVRNTVSVIPDREGAASFLITIVEDITELKRAEAEAERSRRRLEVLSRRLLDAQEGERRVIARELHDQIGQALTALRLNLAALHPPRDRVPTLTESLEIVDQAIEAVRSLSLEVRPSLLDDLGLAAALRWYVDRQTQHADLRARVRTELPDTRLPAGLETACFRVAQEAVTNAVRHADADAVDVEIRADGRTLQLTVHDDGRGFDVPTVWRDAAAGACIGLDGMRERVLLAGGEFEVESAPGRGTTVRARFQLPANDAPGSADHPSAMRQSHA